MVKIETGSPQQSDHRPYRDISPILGYDVQPRPGFYTGIDHFVLTPEDIQIGRAMELAWEKVISRPTPWEFKDNVIIIDKPYNPKEPPIPPTPLVPGVEFVVQDVRQRIVITNNLPNELIRPEAADGVEQFMVVELYNNDYMQYGAVRYRGNPGLSRNHAQWSKEEGQHSNAQRLILATAGGRELSYLIDLQNEALRKGWKPPFETDRQMVAYAFFQEDQTKLAYWGIADKIRQDGNRNPEFRAPTVEFIIRHLIAQDEAYHHFSYRQFLEIYAGFDLQGTIEDVVYVAMNYEGPSQSLLPNYQVEANAKGLRTNAEQAGRIAVLSGGLTKKMISHGTLYKGLNELSFIPKEKGPDGKNIAERIRDNYWQKAA